MAHAKLNLSRMHDWIERNLDLDLSIPTDAEIMDRFGFDSAESARTLLAELADAGRITIKGYGETRTIVLGRVKSAAVAAPRPTPAVRKTDPVIDAGVAKIARILARGGNTAAARTSAAAETLSAARTKPPSASSSPAKPVAPRRAAPTKPKEPAPMPAKTVCLPASAVVAIVALEEHAKAEGLTLGAAAAALIERGAGRVEAVAPTPEASPPATLSLDALFAMLRERFDDRPDLSGELAAAIARAEAAENRAAVAEHKFEQAKAFFA